MHHGTVRLAVKPLVLICMADFFREKNIVPWLISQRISWLIRPAEHSHGVMRAADTNEDPPAECVHAHLVIKIINYIIAEKQL